MKLIGIMIFLSIFIGCSSTSREIEKEKRNVGEVGSREAMIDQMRDIIDQNTKLTQEQKDQFVELHAGVMEKVLVINENIRKLKIVLFQEMSEVKPNQAKMNKIVSQIKKDHQKKLDVMLKSFFGAKDILGIHFKDIEYDRFHHPFSSVR